uniref:Uncharacterized protein n=1 Tax=Kryptolebias marmoratus TaxID=37003 RepID=A0A3Q3B4G3_KRYMA
ESHDKTDAFLPSVQEMQFWLNKAVAWGQADSSDTGKDTCRHLSRLEDFLQQLLAQINTMVSRFTDGQFLGRLCWNPYVTAGETSRELLLQCLWGLYSENPSDAVERKANQWIRVRPGLFKSFLNQNLVELFRLSDYHEALLKRILVKHQDPS